MKLNGIQATDQTALDRYHPDAAPGPCATGLVELDNVIVANATHRRVLTNYRSSYGPPSRGNGNGPNHHLSTDYSPSTAMSYLVYMPLSLSLLDPSPYSQSRLPLHSSHFALLTRHWLPFFALLFKTPALPLPCQLLPTFHLKMLYLMKLFALLPLLASMATESGASPITKREVPQGKLRSSIAFAASTKADMVRAVAQEVPHCHSAESSAQQPRQDPGSVSPSLLTRSITSL